MSEPRASIQCPFSPFLLNYLASIGWLGSDPFFQYDRWYVIQVNPWKITYGFESEVDAKEWAEQKCTGEHGIFNAPTLHSAIAEHIDRRRKSLVPLFAQDTLAYWGENPEAIIKFIEQTLVFDVSPVVRKYVQWYREAYGR